MKAINDEDKLWSDHKLTFGTVSTIFVELWGPFCYKKIVIKMYYIQKVINTNNMDSSFTISMLICYVKMI